jgi:RNA polymerase sigma-70 factor (ECF subfamily)
VPGSWDLVAAAQAGDREAFGQLYARYAPGVARYIGHRVPDPYLAQDFTGETFARALRRIDSVSDQGRDVGAWLTTIARNLLADHWKSHRTQRETSVATVADDIPDRDPGPEQAVIAAETAARVRAAVARLTPSQQEVIRLRYFDEVPVAQVAAVIGRTDAAVKALAHRGVAALRAELATPPGEPSAQGRTAVDPLIRAHHAVTEMTTRVATQQHRVARQAETRRTARWQTTDIVTSSEQGHDRDTVAEGVACHG